MAMVVIKITVSNVVEVPAAAFLRQRTSHLRSHLSGGHELGRADEAAGLELIQCPLTA